MLFLNEHTNRITDNCRNKMIFWYLIITGNLKGTRFESYTELLSELFVHKI